MKKYLSHWNFRRVLRLMSGVLIIVQGIWTEEWLLAFGGVLFSLMPLLNIGCCGASGCNTPVSKGHRKTEDITCEEVR